MILHVLVIWLRMPSTWFWIAVTLSFLTIAGCTTNTTEITQPRLSPCRNFCTLYQPIMFSASLDSPVTVQEILKNNMKWEALCNEQGMGEKQE